MKRRLVDWRLFLAIALMLLVSYLVFAGIEQARDNRAKGDRIDVLVSELQRQHADAEADRQSSAAERAALLAGQEGLERQYAVLINRQTALLTYLKRHGIEVPTRFIVTTRTLSGASGGTSSTPPRRATRGGSGASSPPAAASPGKSGDKGKAHQRRHPRRH
jgi:hypothetical protein